MKFFRFLGIMQRVFTLKVECPMKRRSFKLVALSLIAFFLVVLLAYLGWASRAVDSPDQGKALHLPVVKDRVRLLIFGDQGSGSENQRRVGRSLEEQCLTGIDGILLLGDNFYPNGVTSVDDSQWKEKFEDMYSGPCLSQTPFYVTFGNHDYKGNPQAVIEYGKKSKRWVSPGRFYTLQFDDFLEVIDFDSTIADWCFEEGKCSLSFLMSSLEKPRNAAWRIVAGHHPFRSSSSKGFTYNGKDLRAFILRKIICGKADLALFGHSHHLEMRQDSDCETPFAVLGAAGADLVKVKALDQPLFLYEGFGFGDLVLSKNELNLVFRDDLGKELYRKKITK
jgi:predicted phosphodiesterase